MVIDFEIPDVPRVVTRTKSAREPLQPRDKCPCGCGYAQPDIIRSELEKIRKGTWLEEREANRSPIPKHHCGVLSSKRFRRLASNHERRARQMGLPWDVVNLELVYRHHGGICGVCKKEVDRDIVTFDHVVALTHGGAHVWENLQLAHLACNSKKGPKRSKNKQRGETAHPKRST